MPTIFSDLLICLAVAASVSLLLSVAVTGVPALASSRSETRDVIALLEQAQLPANAVIVDLGSGWGTLVVALARAFPDARVQGVEMSPLPYWVSRLRTRALSNVSLRWGNFFRSDLRHADAITCYLMPGLMPRVRDKLDSGLRPGTRVVTNTFLFRGRAICASRHRALRGTVALYIWPARHWVVG